MPTPTSLKTLTDTCCTKETLKIASDVSLVLGFLSIAASIGAWFTARDENRAHAERFGIFVGLWVPSFFILSNRLAHQADALPVAKPDVTIPAA